MNNSNSNSGRRKRSIPYPCATQFWHGKGHLWPILFWSVQHVILGENEKNWVFAILEVCTLHKSCQ